MLAFARRSSLRTEDHVVAAAIDLAGNTVVVHVAEFDFIDLRAHSVRGDHDLFDDRAIPSRTQSGSIDDTARQIPDQQLTIGRPGHQKCAVGRPLCSRNLGGVAGLYDNSGLALFQPHGLCQQRRAKAG